MFEYVPYILMFAVAAMILYGWGLYRSMHRRKDLTRMLLSKGVGVIRKQLKDGKGMTKKELEPHVKYLSAGLPFSRAKLSVTDSRQFLESVLSYMSRQQMIRSEKKTGKTVYYLTGKK